MSEKEEKSFTEVEGDSLSLVLRALCVRSESGEHCIILWSNTFYSVRFISP